VLSALSRLTEAAQVAGGHTLFLAGEAGLGRPQYFTVPAPSRGGLASASRRAARWRPGWPSPIWVSLASPTCWPGHPMVRGRTTGCGCSWRYGIGSSNEPRTAPPAGTGRFALGRRGISGAALVPWPTPGQGPARHCGQVRPWPDGGAALAGAGKAEILSLAPLSDGAERARYLEKAPRGRDPVQAEAVVRLAAGNPMLVVEAA
jgi:hypothetical protein